MTASWLWLRPLKQIQSSSPLIVLVSLWFSHNKMLSDHDYTSSYVSADFLFTTQFYFKTKKTSLLNQCWPGLHVTSFMMKVMSQVIVTCHQMALRKALQLVYVTFCANDITGRLEEYLRRYWWTFFYWKSCFSFYRCLRYWFVLLSVFHWVFSLEQSTDCFKQYLYISLLLNVGYNMRRVQYIYSYKMIHNARLVEHF